MVRPEEFKARVRGILSQEYELEFHLGDHKYYDKVRKSMDLKKTSY